MIKSAYIHIPFCPSICSYCDFCKLFYNSKLVDKYLNELDREIDKIYKQEILDTIYIGGGTPNSLNLNQLEKLLKIISKLKTSNNLEYTIEGNFNNTTKEKLELYKKYGINRLSFGLESINKKNLEFLNRKEDKDIIERVINLSRSLGFNNINIDLMYAMPSEDITIVKEDLDYILSLNPEHISTYSLIIEDNTKLKINNIKNISEDLDYKMYKIISKTLKDNNYKHYEISNFSKDYYYSRHNITYWNNNEYYGFGLGASSYIDNKRITNTRSINKYLESNYQKEVEILSTKDKIEYEILLNLRKSSGISLINFKKKYNDELKDIYNYQSLLNNNLLIEIDNHLLIPEDKWYISNEIIVEILKNEIRK